MTANELITNLIEVLKTTFGDQFKYQQGVDYITEYKKPKISLNIYGLDLDNSFNMIVYKVQIRVQIKDTKEYFKTFNDIVDKTADFILSCFIPDAVVDIVEVSFPINENEYGLVEAVINLDIKTKK